MLADSSRDYLIHPQQGRRRDRQAERLRRFHVDDQLESRWLLQAGSFSAARPLMADQLEELPRPRLPGALQDLLWRPFLDDPPVGHEHDPVGDLARKAN